MNLRKWNTSERYGRLYESGGGFYNYTGKLFDLVAVSIFWLLGSLAVITAGASFTALYAAASRSIRQDIGTVSSKFWTSYKRNFKEALGLWLIFGGAVALLLLNYGIVREQFTGLAGLFLQMLYLLCALLMIAAANYGFAALSRFDMPLPWMLRLSVYLTFRHLLRTLGLIALFAAAYLLLLVQPLVLFVLPGVYALLASMLIDPVLEQHMPKQTSISEGE